LLTEVTVNLATLLFTNPQRLKSEECGDHAVGTARQLHLSGNNTWGLVHTRVKKFSEERLVLEKNNGTVFVNL
jgi:hypothetical protein